MAIRKGHRMIEPPQSGRGKVFEGDNFLKEIDYKLRVFQEIHHVNTSGKSEEVGGLVRIEGTICNGGDLFGLSRELTLHLEDGRSFNFIIQDSSGRFIGTGGFSRLKA